MKTFGSFTAPLSHYPSVAGAVLFHPEQREREGSTHFARSANSHTS
jgi:hypothetical protein